MGDKPVKSCLSWLYRFTDPERKFLQHPATVLEGDDRWTVTSGYHVLIALRGVMFAGLPCNQEETQRQFLRFLPAARPGGGPSVAWSDLVAWAGPAVWWEVCPDCDGFGFQWSDRGPGAICDSCDGDRVLEPDADVGVLFGRPVNRLLLARAAEGLEAEMVTVLVAGGEDEPILIDAPNWRLVLMLMSETAGPNNQAEEDSGRKWNKDEADHFPGPAVVEQNS